MKISKTIASSLVGLSLLCCIGGCKTTADTGPADLNAVSADYARLLAAHYRLLKREETSIREIHLGISLFSLTPEYQEDCPLAPRYFVAIDAPDRRPLVIALEGSYDLEAPPYLLLTKAREPLLCIADTFSGNGWNSARIHVFSLATDHFLEFAGYVSHIGGLEGLSKDDLATMDDRWESGIGYTCHADAPGCVLFWKVKDGVLTLDAEGHLPYYRAELKRLDGVIGSYPRDKAKGGDQKLLSAILTRAMIRWHVGEAQKGWDEFRSEVRRFDDAFFPLSNGLDDELRKIPVSEIEGIVREMYGILAPVSPAALETPVPPGSETYVVHAMDTYYSIAEKFYGDGSKWMAIVNANPQLWDYGTAQPNMEAFRIGATIVIPRQP